MRCGSSRLSEEGRRQRHADQIGRQHRLAAGDRSPGRRAPSRINATNLVSGSLTRSPTLSEQPRRESRQQQQDHAVAAPNHSQPHVVVREHHTERQHRAKVVDEAGGENDLADLGAVEAGLDHHRVDDRHRHRRQRDPGDLRLRPWPTDRVMRVGEDADIGGEEADDADGHGGTEMFAHHARIDFRAGEKGQHDRAEPGEEIHPFRQRKADRIAGERADHDLDQGHRNGDANRNDRGDQRQTDPQRRSQPNLPHRRLASLCHGEQRRADRTAKRLPPHVSRQESPAWADDFGGLHPLRPLLGI